MQFSHRRVLLGLVVGAYALTFPVLASAKVNPSLAITSNGVAGATNQTLSYDLSFNPQSPTSDSPASISTTFPEGLLADSTLDGGKCLTQTAQDPNCLIGSGHVTLQPVPGSAPAFEYLVQPPKAGDVAGILLAIGGQPGQAAGVADVKVQNGDTLNVTFSNLPGPTSNPAQPQLTDISLQLTHLRFPSRCAAEQMTVNTVSENGDHESTNTPFQSTACPNQPYAPMVSDQIMNFASGAEVTTTITQQANEAPSSSNKLQLPANLTTNQAALLPCLGVSNCPIGTASALAPLAPSQALANGKVTIDVSGSVPLMHISFPAPYALTLTGVVDPTHNSLTFSKIPDVPLTKLTVILTGTSTGKLYTTDCKPGNVMADFTGQGGQMVNRSVPLNYVSGCGGGGGAKPGAPTGSGSLSGLTSRHPGLRLHLSHGSNAPKLRSVSIGLGSGLSFKRSAIVNRKHAKGLTVSGAKVKSVQVKGGKLVITLVRPVSALTIKVHGPLLSESKSLQTKVKHHTVKRLSVHVKMTDASGKATTKTLHLKA